MTVLAFRRKRRRGGVGEYWTSCTRCQAGVTSSKSGLCAKCRRDTKSEAANRRTLRRLTSPTHIAGYVPPKGSIAWSLLGHVIDPVRGIGVVSK